jgi:hypothetical protein
MYPNYDIHRATTTEDEATIKRLAQLDSADPIAGDALIAERDGKALAAVSMADGRVIADPFERTERVAQVLRMRRRAIDAATRTPDVTRRVRAAVATVARARPTT